MVTRNHIRTFKVRHHVDASKFVLPSITLSLESSLRAKTQISGTLRDVAQRGLGLTEKQAQSLRG